MAKKGYFNVSINYRLYGPGCSAAGGGSQVGCIQAMIDAQHDAQAAVRFLRKHAATYKIDPDRIAIGGSSAGAITALNVAANAEDPGTSGNPGFSSTIKGAVSLSGAKVLGAPMSSTDAPILMFHGTADPLVPYQWAVNTLNQANDAGVVAYLTTYQGEGHVPFNHYEQIFAQTDELPLLGARPAARLHLSTDARVECACQCFEMKPSQVPVVRMFTAVAAPPMRVAMSVSSNAPAPPATIASTSSRNFSSCVCCAVVKRPRSVTAAWLTVWSDCASANVASGLVPENVGRPAAFVRPVTTL